METPRDDQLSAELRALRPTPQPEFVAELDERAAAGFRRRSRLPLKSPPDFFTAVRNKRPAHLRRMLIPAGGVAVLAIAVATAVVVSGGSKEGTRSLSMDSGSSLEFNPGGGANSKFEPAKPSAQYEAGSAGIESGAEEIAPWRMGAVL